MNSLKPYKLAALVSGRGTNLQAIIDSIERKELDAHLSIVISNIKDAPAMIRAEKYGVETIFIDPASYPNRKSYDQALIDKLKVAAIDLICLAGYMRILGEEFILNFSRKIINIHPSLLPKFGGKGMFGENVHQSVIESGEKESGITIHYVNNNYDEGGVILQEKCSVSEDETIESLSEKIQKLEHEFFPKTIEKIILK